MPEVNFKGKEFVFNHHLSVPYCPLIPHPDKSIGEESENFIIQGDNLHALKALLPRYAGKVDCVIIDPPYNTGNESWCYNDNVNNPIMQEWLNSNPVNKDDMLRHDKWLCMMMPRLKLLSELMSANGLIAVHVDDNEVDHLCMLMDEIFGNDKRLACSPWRSEPSGGKEKTGLRTGHEYIVIYYLGNPAEITQQTEDIGELKLEDKFGPYAKGRELRKWGGISLRSDRKKQFYPLIAPNGIEVYPIRNDGEEGHWRWGRENEKIKAILDDPEHAHWEKRPYDEGVTYDGESERWVPYQKIRTREKSVGWSTWLDSHGTNADATRMLKEIFGKKVFDTPKPLKLYEWLISLHSNEDAFVLDCFAGSGTTGHAVLSLNANDGGYRRFILIESEDFIDSVTAERARRVIKGYEYQGIQKKELLYENLTYTKLRNAERLLKRIAGIENLYGSNYDKITKTVKNGQLIVTGEKKITQRVEGLQGDFTYYTLGDPLDLDSLLTGDVLPDYLNMGSWLFHTATGETLDSEVVDEDNWYLGESKNYHLWLIYKPDLDFLKSREASLTLSLAEKISKAYKGKKHLVFSPSRYVSNKMLFPLGVEHAPLPFVLYRFEKD